MQKKKKLETCISKSTEKNWTKETHFVGSPTSTRNKAIL